MDILQFVRSPQLPSPGKKNREKGRREKGGIQVGHEEGLRVCPVGENSLDKRIKVKSVIGLARVSQCRIRR